MKASPVQGPRKNEVRSLLKKSLWALAERLDKGYNFDVRASADSDAADVDEPNKLVSSEINKVRKSLQMVEVSAEHILELPPGEELKLEDGDVAGADAPPPPEG